MIRLATLPVCEECRNFSPVKGLRFDPGTGKTDMVVYCGHEYMCAAAINTIRLSPEARKMMEEYVYGNGKA